MTPLTPAQIKCPECGMPVPDVPYEILCMVRKGDLETCHQAAADTLPHASANQLRVLKLISQRPLTDYELEYITGRQKNSIGKRRSDLYRAGLVEPTLDEQGNKVKRPGPSRSLCIVWRITEAGKAYLKNNQ